MAKRKGIRSRIHAHPSPHFAQGTVFSVHRAISIPTGGQAPRHGNGCCCGVSPRFPYPRAGPFSVCPTTGRRPDALRVFSFVAYYSTDPDSCQVGICFLYAVNARLPRRGKRPCSARGSRADRASIGWNSCADPPQRRRPQGRISRRYRARGKGDTPA